MTWRTRERVQRWQQRGSDTLVADALASVGRAEQPPSVDAALAGRRHLPRAQREYRLRLDMTRTASELTGLKWTARANADIWHVSRFIDVGLSERTVLRAWARYVLARVHHNRHFSIGEFADREMARR